MNKTDLIDAISTRTRHDKANVTLVVDALTESIIDSLAEGKKISFLGFGTFEPRERAARKGVNPKQVKRSRYLQSVYLFSKQASCLNLAYRTKTLALA